MNPELKKALIERIVQYPYNKVDYAIGMATGLQIAAPLDQPVDPDAWDMVADVIARRGEFAEAAE